MSAVDKSGACLPTVKKYTGGIINLGRHQSVQKSGGVGCLPAEGWRREDGEVIEKMV